MCVMGRMGQRAVLRLAVKLHRDLRIEDEGIPREPPAWPKRSRDTLERAAAVSPGWQMQERPERAVNQSCGFVEFQIAHVTFAQVEAHARIPCTGPRLPQHRW